MTTTELKYSVNADLAKLLSLLSGLPYFSKLNRPLGAGPGSSNAPFFEFFRYGIHYGGGLLTSRCKLKNLGTDPYTISVGHTFVGYYFCSHISLLSGYRYLF